MVKNKKAQFYILIAVILVGIAFSIVQASETFKEPDQLFSQLTENLEKESSNMINNAIYEENVIEDEYNPFFISFIKFAKTRDPKFEAIYLLKNKDKITIYSEIKDAIVLKDGGSRINIYYQGTRSLTDKDIVTLTYNDIDYDFNFNQKDVQLKILVISRKSGDLRIKLINLS
ncbi:MAG: hypothetical protein V1740_02640 [Candidatus Woesearchaeota archaeon]